MPRDTGLPRADAQSDFSRARRRRALARLSARLRRGGRREPHPPVRGGRRRRSAGPASGGSASRRSRSTRSWGRWTARASSTARSGRPRRACASAGSASTCAQRRGTAHAADRRLPDRRHALRQGRPPPRLGGPRARAQGHQRVRDRGAHAGRREPRDPHARPAAEEPRAALLRPRAAPAGGARADPPEGRVDLRGARRGGGGLGLQGDPGAAAADVTPRGGGGVVPRGVRAGGGDARRGAA